MGTKLLERKIQPDLIVSSPANRALSTASLIANELKYPIDQITHNQDIYAASTEQLLKVINQLPNTSNRVMIFGHNPGMSQVATYLTDENLVYPTCAVAAIQFDMNSWTEVSGGTGKLLFFDYPKRYEEMR